MEIIRQRVNSSFREIISRDAPFDADLKVYLIAFEAVWNAYLIFSRFQRDYVETGKGKLDGWHLPMLDNWEDAHAFVCEVGLLRKCLKRLKGFNDGPSKFANPGFCFLWHAGESAFHAGLKIARNVESATAYAWAELNPRSDLYHFARQFGHGVVQDTHGQPFTVKNLHEVAVRWWIYTVEVIGKIPDACKSVNIGKEWGKFSAVFRSEAEKHFEGAKSLPSALSDDDLSRIAHIIERHLSRSELLASEKHATETVIPPKYLFRRKNGNMWDLQYGGEKGHFHNTVGFRRIARLLKEQDKDVAIALLCDKDPSKPAEHRTQDPVMDEEGIQKSIEEINDLELRSEKAKGHNNKDLVAKLQSEAKKIRDLIETSTGHEFSYIQNYYSRSGKCDVVIRRTLGPDSLEKTDANAVKVSLKRTYELLEQEGMPQLATHLRNSIKTDRYFGSYRPDRTMRWDL